MAEAVGQVGGGVDVELVVFEKPLTLFVHGNTFPRLRRDLPSRKCYLCLENMCYRCPGVVHIPSSEDRLKRASSSRSERAYIVNHIPRAAGAVVNTWEILQYRIFVASR